MPKAPEAALLQPFPDATAQFEAWLRSQIAIRANDLDFKHEQMATGLFPFMRATFYRWMQLWPVLCPELAGAPSVLAVGDLHLDNFGTWRDQEGRLIWGVNDFDEAYPLAYTADLVRLAVSGRMAITIDRLRLSPRRAIEAMLDGYRRGLDAGGTPFVLAENHPVLRREASGVLRDPVRFWQRMRAQPENREVPEPLVRMLTAGLPRDVSPTFRDRRAGLGSLGHVRVVAAGSHNGGLIAREAKALAPSACVWAASSQGAPAIHYPTIVRRAVRAPDPFLQIKDGFVVRRLAPDCSRIEATTVRAVRDQAELAHAMGAETANIHLGAGPARIEEVRRHLKSLPEGWLRDASKVMLKATQRDFDSWLRWRGQTPQAGAVSGAASRL
ncbi:MAG: DUF2252 family protein [Candidatus Dormibacteria bacterium]